MKIHIKYFSVVLAALAFVSCDKLAPGKAEVESNFATPKVLPSLTIGEAVADAAHKVVNVSVTVSGMPADASDIELGVLTSLDPAFASSRFVAAKEVADGTFIMQGAVTPDATYYVMAVATSLESGASYSDVIEVAVPKVPFWAQLPGSYVGHVESELEDSQKYDNTLIVVADEKDPEHYVWIADIEPYWAYDGGHSGETLEFNYVRASVDEANKCLVIADRADIHLGGRIVRGVDAVSIYDAEYYAPIVFEVLKDGSLYRKNAYTTYAGGDLENSWGGDVTYSPAS
jgi:hypothetical protein